MENDRHIKGTHIINVINFVKKKRGAVALNTLFERINKDKSKPRQLSADSFIEKEWYPYELYLEFLSTADDVTGTGDLSRCYEMGHQTVKNLGHLSFLARSPNVFDFLKNGRDNWNRIYDFGKVDIVKETEGKIIIRYHGFPKSKTKCEYFRGSLTGMMELCELKGEVQETACNAESAEYCEFTLTWS